MKQTGKDSESDTNRRQQANKLIKNIKQSCYQGQYEIALKTVNQLTTFLEEEYQERLTKISDKYCEVSHHFAKGIIKKHYLQDQQKIELIREIIEMQVKK